MNALILNPVAAAVPQQTLAEIAKDYLDAYAGRDGSRYSRIAAWVRLMGDKPFAGITPEDIDTALDTLANEPARTYGGKDADGNTIFRAKRKTPRKSGATLNRYAVALAALFTWARRNRYLPRTFESPTRFVQKNPETRGRVRYLNDDERARLLAACRESVWPRLYLLALMAITTGARKGELLGLRWSDIDIERGEATLHDTKNGDRRLLVLLPTVLDELAQFAPKDAPTSTALVFRSRLRPMQPYAMVKPWNQAVQDADIRDFRFHDMRHTAASYLAQAGASLLEIADTLGHRQLRMVQRYAHLNTSSRRSLMNRVFEGRL